MQKAYLLITNETKDADNFKPRCDASRERKKKACLYRTQDGIQQFWLQRMKHNNSQHVRIKCNYNVKFHDPSPH